MTMDQQTMAESLMELASREKALFEGPIGDDPELRQVTMWNLAVLCAAAEQMDKMAKLVPGSRPTDSSCP